MLNLASALVSRVESAGTGDYGKARANPSDLIHKFSAREVWHDQIGHENVELVRRSLKGLQGCHTARMTFDAVPEIFQSGFPNSHENFLIVYQ